jgi:SPP1 family predicted phage head-tail adaptor
MARIGRLRHRLRLQTATETLNAHGEAVRTWSDAATVWGSLEPLRGVERFTAQQVQADVTHRCRMRHHEAITYSAAMRVMHGGRTFHVQGPPLNLEERDRMVELLLIEATDVAS